jgi:hypothetical protein
VETKTVLVPGHVSSFFTLIIYNMPRRHIRGVHAGRLDLQDLTWAGGGPLSDLFVCTKRGPMQLISQEEAFFVFFTSGP